jgi:hypothetical protein
MTPTPNPAQTIPPGNPIASGIQRWMVGLATLCTLVSVPAFAQEDDAEPELELYVDRETKQVFTEPGPNRRRLGSFRRTQEPKPAPPAAAVEATPATAVEAAPATAVAVPVVPPSEVSAPGGAVPSGPTTGPAAAPPAATADTKSDVLMPTEAEQRLEARQRKLEERIDKLATAAPAPAVLSPKKWYDNISLRGYVQTRLNSVVGGDEDIRLWNDGSVGEDRSFMIRRARLIVSGDVSDRLFVYLQPDFATTAGDTGNVAQLRDFYGDISFDKEKEYRLRVGQSKIPYSFEDLQSSQNRLALDRNDALNSSTLAERDLGLFFYYAPAKTRALFRDLVRSGLKGSGDYGMFAFGVYNGQGSNRPELNDNMHVVSRFTYPFKTESGQIFEAGIAGYSGRVTPTTDGRIAGLPANIYRDGGGFRDRRVALHAMMYPQPFGLQAEWNWGEGPALNDARTAIENQSLHGGYVQAMYRIDRSSGTGIWIPFVRWQYYDGAIKYQPNAPQTNVNDWEFGVEWQPDPSVELAVVYHKFNRNDVTRVPYAAFQSDVLRMQLQINF